jgi:hypothetical protein
MSAECWNEVLADSGFHLVVGAGGGAPDGINTKAYDVGT